VSRIYLKTPTVEVNGTPSCNKLTRKNNGVIMLSLLVYAHSLLDYAGNHEQLYFMLVVLSTSVDDFLKRNLSFLEIDCSFIMS
jgi:hypothetical protein